ncbi:MAG TPA: hypothetical protein PKE63_13635 [Lacibacter sp.]|nr:hypothetical protein [Lacibacter sp.]HMO90354.1 hypothetical protein [Lacibacter sp.]HMP88315.1 hypothetical protein [Lacibacter sp.]
MKKFSGLILLAGLLLSGCTTTRLTTVWSDPELKPAAYKNIMVVTLMEGVTNRELRVYFENHMAEDLVAMGYNARAATAVYGPRSFNGKTEDEVIALLRNDGYDAVITITVLDVAKEDTYVQGQMDVWPGGIYYSRFGRYYYYWYNRVYTPGYYVTSTRYIVEGNLFDAKADKLVYSAQTETIDPSTLDNLGHRFSIRLLRSMKENGVL